MLDRTLSSPPMSSAQHKVDLEVANSQKARLSDLRTPLTPPTSPLVRHQSEGLNSTEDHMDAVALLAHPSTLSLGLNIATCAHHDAHAAVEGSFDNPSILAYPHELEIVRDRSGRPSQFGSGAWSTVYKAVSHPVHAPLEDELTITRRQSMSSSSLVVAVKTPHRGDGHKIIHSEARILTHLAQTRESEKHVVPFHGYILTTGSIVMSAIPLSLSDYITNRALKIRSTYTGHTRTAPVVGNEAIWLSLTTQLIDSLKWLHELAGIVHGDIKPHNILLKPTSLVSLDSEDQEQIEQDSILSFPYTPLLIDFSSSTSVLPDSRLRSPTALSALTLEYTAPELLQASVLRDPNSVPTAASDVFSLAVSTLVAATGDLDVYPSTNTFQRQAMASQGWNVIDFARNGPSGERIPRFGTVEQVLERAVLKDGLGRVDAATWADIVREKARGAEPTKKQQP